MIATTVSRIPTTARVLPSLNNLVRARHPSTRLFSTIQLRARIAPTNPLRAIAAPAVGSYAPKDGEHVLNSPSELARKLSAKVLPQLDRPKLASSITPVHKPCREEGVEAVLINPNIATWQTSHQLASEVYFLPITADRVAYVLEEERPDGILLTFGGQSALNVGIALDKMGVLDRLGVKVLGTPIKTLEVSEDRDLFVQALKEVDIPVAQSTAVSTVDAALEAPEKIGYPVILRAAFTLGGLGSGFANNPIELRDLSAKSLSLSPQVLIERSMKGWKELEYEVVRDAADNTIICCNMENFDPLGTHTGGSIVVAPSQTLNDDEYHMLRSAAIKVIRHLGVVGECNIQYALNPKSRAYCVIEVNARSSRSSALASKATGYPLAYTAAKIALGYTLPELPNAVTKTTTACFEPSLDYIVTKIPKWDLAKFSTEVNREVGSAMKSVGEVMAIGRTFEESLQKAIRMVDPRWRGFEVVGGLEKLEEEGELERALKRPTDMRLFAIAYAMYNDKYNVQEIHDLTKIDKWFLYKIENIVNTSRALSSLGNLPAVPPSLMLDAKRQGSSDSQISSLLNSTEGEVRNFRKSQDPPITPFVKRIDTLAAEYPAHTNYLYTTYNASAHDVTFDEHGTMVLGSGVYRIGSSVEFDWCAVTCTRTLREMGDAVSGDGKSVGGKTIMVNYNPETVSTDFDEADRLYFEELGWERVMDIYELEGAKGVIVSVGAPAKHALRLKESGVNVLGTDPSQIDNAEDRHKFSSVLDSIGVDQPEWTEVTSLEAAKVFANRVRLLPGPQSALSHTLTAASSVSPLHPVITKFISNAQEIDVDAVAYKGQLLVYAISEHVENAGVHSGDATLVLPPYTLGERDLDRLKDITSRVAQAFEISGPFNMQVIKKPASQAGEEDELKVIKCNLRASRSFPFVSKVLGHNFIETAAAAVTGVNVPEPIDLMKTKRDYTCIKVAQFSWTRLGGADPFLGVGANGKHGTPARIPVSSPNTPELPFITKTLHSLGFKLYVSSPAVEAALTAIPHVTCKRIFFPTSDKRRLREVFDEYEIQSVINLAQGRGKGREDEDYVARRNAVDFGLPLLNNAKCAALWVEALKRKMGKDGNG
ncbi:carbamoyl-phosphate synthase, partial [Imleria badia]